MKLIDYLKKERYSAAEASQLLGKNKSYLSQVLRGKAFPSKKTAKAIEEFTKGQVKMEDLINKKKEQNICPVCKRRMPKKIKK